MSTKIQWTEETWNPVQGCFKKSPGCKNCYAIRQVQRLSSNPNEKIQRRYFNIVENMNWTGKTGIDDEVLLRPLQRKKPTTYFISLSDLFYELRPATDIYKVLAVISQSPQHRFQVLTKYAERMQEVLSDVDLEDRIDDAGSDLGWCHANAAGRLPLPNLWLGVSVENQHYSDARVRELLKTPAAVRFISYEPALGPVDFDLGGIDWVIVGGESGPGARQFNIEWARSTVRQCRALRVPVFVKQLGAKPTGLYGIDIPIEAAVFDKKGGEPSEWPEDLRVREYPTPVESRV